MTEHKQTISLPEPAGLQPFLDSLNLEGRPRLATHLRAALQECGAPETALVRLQRYLEVSRTPHAELDLMDATLRYTRMLLTILGQSHYLTDILCRNPEYMSWLWEEAELENARSRDELVRELLRMLANFDAFDARCQALRRFKRREILRIATRDIFIHVPLASLTEDLSNLAEATLEAAYQSAHRDLEPRFGNPMCASGTAECGFCALGMGKLGGRELNFSSDIDLIFIYAADGATSGGSSGSISVAEYFHKLGERIIKALAEVTSEGSVFRVDMRLRPHGRMGPLAVDIDTALRYYEIEGQAWERQALIKMRPCAGDLALGDRFIELTRPFVFPRFFDDETLEDIRNVKRQMEAQVAGRGETDTEVKLGRGGIRDVEFTVQVLQLLNGGRYPELRSGTTLEAIKALGMFGVLKPLDATALASNYTFMRHVEHRLQIEGSQQRHALPKDPAELDALAKRLGYASDTSFLADYQDRAEATRKILDQFLATEGAGNLWVSDALNPHSDGHAGLEGLRSLGFKEPVRAREELLVLYAGTRERPHSLRVRQQFAAVAPILLKALARSANPDATLLRLGQILANLRAPATIYDMLKWAPNLSGYLTTLVENSEFLAGLLIRDPGLFDTFGRPGALERPSSREDLQAQLDALSNAYDRDAAPYRLHAGETLRIGMRDLIQGADVVTIGEELTLLAEVCLEYTVDAARKRVVERYGESSGAFAVLGLGKMGGREIGYGSDLDLVFVYDSGATIESGMSPIEYFTAVASHIIKALKEPTRYGILYDIDARLRPDGKKGSLVVSDARLEEYYSGEAQAWERLALVKARAVAGDPDFGDKVERRARDIAFALPLTQDNLANIEDVRQKIVASSNARNLKKDEGGIAELEFAIRLLQLRHAAAHPELKRGDVLGSLTLLENGGILAPADAATLRDTYLLFRRIENRLRIMHGRATSSLPVEPEAIAGLGRRLSLGDSLAEEVARRKAGVHTVYNRVLGTLMPGRDI
ncbi:MAG: bifunctional [glutamate--ammonia ligase]-adenylyl-L-tyrosine phosphorylase/[glutamate--ammonia-ligase] adenylyltransferase [Candidatus Hydrogenedentes bacterium]|nr:bifunctional [glutamate--ammonia ligase]-adenylyl-L-tyrosine phosphorylase/[glutamate--ammonia-ligase] adenylyltransferase [Candidatus Hydrogenedentota bacterium]